MSKTTISDVIWRKVKEECDLDYTSRAAEPIEMQHKAKVSKLCKALENEDLSITQTLSSKSGNEKSSGQNGEKANANSNNNNNNSHSEGTSLIRNIYYFCYLHTWFADWSCGAIEIFINAYRDFTESQLEEERRQNKLRLKPLTMPQIIDKITLQCARKFTRDHYFAAQLLRELKLVDCKITEIDSEFAHLFSLGILEQLTLSNNKLQELNNVPHGVQILNASSNKYDIYTY